MAALKGNEYYKLRTKDGRDRIFKNTDAFAKACNEYFEWVINNPLMEAVLIQKTGQIVSVPKMRPFSLEGLCNYIDISLKTFRLYEQREDFIPVVLRVRQIIENQQFEGASAGFLNPSIISRKLGLVEKQEVSQDIKVEDSSGIKSGIIIGGYSPELETKIKEITDAIKKRHGTDNSSPASEQN